MAIAEYLMRLEAISKGVVIAQEIEAISMAFLNTP